MNGPKRPLEEQENAEDKKEQEVPAVNPLERQALDLLDEKGPAKKAADDNHEAGPTAERKSTDSAPKIGTPAGKDSTTEAMAVCGAFLLQKLRQVAEFRSGGNGDGEQQPKSVEKAEKTPTSYERLAEQIKVSDATTTEQDQLRQLLPTFESKLLSAIAVAPTATAGGDNKLREDVAQAYLKDSAAGNDSAMKALIKDMPLDQLRALMKLEATDAKLAQMTGFKAAHETFRQANDWLNSSVIDANSLLASAGLTPGPGNPLRVPSVITQDGQSYAKRGNAFADLMASGPVDSHKLRELVAADQLNTTLILNPEAPLSQSNLQHMENSLGWLQDNREPILLANEKTTAAGMSKLFQEGLSIDMPGWQPPKDGSLADYIKYNERASEALNLIYQVRNCAEALAAIKGMDESRWVNFGMSTESKKDALGKNFPGELKWEDAEHTKIAPDGLHIKLPDNLMATRKDEGEFQVLRNWMDKYASGATAQSIKEFQRGVPVGVGNVPAEGEVVRDGDKVVAVKSKDGNVFCVVDHGKEGSTPNVYYRSLDGEFRDSNNKPAADEKALLALADKPGLKHEHFDYFSQDVGAQRLNDGQYQISYSRDYAKGHGLDYQQHFGSPRGSTLEKRLYGPTEQVIGTDFTGQPQSISAKNVAAWAALQTAIFRGGQGFAAALDIGMIVTGSIELKAGLYAGSRMAVAKGGFRALLGAGGLIDPLLQQSEAGKMIAHGRHLAIVGDVSLGLAKPLLSAVTFGRLGAESASAAKVAEVIKGWKTASSVKHVTEMGLKTADAYFLPTLSQQVAVKLKEWKGISARQYGEAAAEAYGEGPQDIVSQSYARVNGKTPPPAADRADQGYNTYESLIKGAATGDQLAVHKVFDGALKASISPEQARKHSGSELISYFRPSQNQCQQWRKSNGDELAYLKGAAPGALEKSAEDAEKTAVAISLLKLAVQDGQRPANGVLAARDVKLDGYDYEEPIGEGASITIHVPEATIKQEIKDDEIVKYLQSVALSDANPGAALAASDALYRYGALSTSRYASNCADLLNGNAAGSTPMIQERALTQLASLIALKKSEEASGMTASSGRDYGLSSAYLEGQLQKALEKEKDPDFRALELGILHAGKSTESEKRLEELASDWEKLREQPGEFHKAFVAKLKADLDHPLDAKTTAENDALRATSIEAAQSLRALSAATGEQDYRADVNRALLKNISFSDGLSKWPVFPLEDRPNPMVTVSAISELSSHLSELDKDQQKVLRDAAMQVLNQRFYEPLSASAVGEERAAKQSAAHYDAELSQMLVLSQLGQLLPGNSSDSAIQKAATAFQNRATSILQPESIAEGWGRNPELRITAIQAIAKLGALPDRDPRTNATLATVAQRLALTEHSQFTEPSPYVRAAALDCLRLLDPSCFGKSAAELKEMRYPDSIRPQELLKVERDPYLVTKLWDLFDQSYSRPDPTSINYVRNVEKETAHANEAVDTSTVRVRLNALAARDPLAFGALDDRVPASEVTPLNNEYGLYRQAKNLAREHRWSGIGGSIEHFFRDWMVGGIETEERTQARTEMMDLEPKRLEAFENFRNRFGSLTAQEKNLALDTFLSVLRDADGDLFRNLDPANNESKSLLEARELAARSLSDIAENWDLCPDKQHLKDVVVAALRTSSDTLSPHVKGRLLDAVDAMTQGPQDSTISLKPGKALFSRQEAGDLYVDVLKQERQRKATGEGYSETLQLRCIDGIHRVRHHGAAALLDSIGPDQRRDGANPGSPIASVKERAQAALSSLWDGVGWIYNDAAPAKSGLNLNRSRLIERAFVDSGKDNFEHGCQDIFRACKDDPIKSDTDGRRRHLQTGLEHPSERIRLACAWMLSQSAVKEDVEKAASTLGKLAVNGKQPATQMESQEILQQMLTSGDDYYRTTASDAWAAASETVQPGTLKSKTVPSMSELERGRVWFRHASADEKSQLASLSWDQQKALLMRLTGMSELQAETACTPPPRLELSNSSRLSQQFPFGVNKDDPLGILSPNRVGQKLLNYQPLYQTVVVSEDSLKLKSGDLNAEAQFMLFTDPSKPLKLERAPRMEDLTPNLLQRLGDRNQVTAADLQEVKQLWNQYRIHTLQARLRNELWGQAPTIDMERPRWQPAGVVRNDAPPWLLKPPTDSLLRYEQMPAGKFLKIPAGTTRLSLDAAGVLQTNDTPADYDKAPSTQGRVLRFPMVITLPSDPKQQEKFNFESTYDPTDRTIRVRPRKE